MVRSGDLLCLMLVWCSMNFVSSDQLKRCDYDHYYTTCKTQCYPVFMSSLWWQKNINIHSGSNKMLHKLCESRATKFFFVFFFVFWGWIGSEMQQLIIFPLFCNKWVDLQMWKYPHSVSPPQLSRHCSSCLTYCLTLNLHNFACFLCQPAFDPCLFINSNVLELMNVLTYKNIQYAHARTWTHYQKNSCQWEQHQTFRGDENRLFNWFFYGNLLILLTQH